MSPPHPPLDGADRLFWEFCHRHPQRPMVCGMQIRLEHPPEKAHVEALFQRLMQESPRLQWSLRQGAPAWDMEPTPLSGHLDWGELPDPEQALREPLLEPLWHCRVSSDVLWLRWHHLLSDAEGMIRLLGSGPPAREAGPGDVTRNVAWWKRLAGLRGRSAQWQLSQGSARIAWKQLEPGVDADELLAWAERGSVSPRTVLTALAARALRLYLAETGAEVERLSILVPAFSLRAADAPLELGNHQRASARVELPAEVSSWKELLLAIQANQPQPAPYGAARVFFSLPDPLPERFLSRIPPVIVNWDEGGWMEGLKELAGVPIREVRMYPPLLPHQGCTFAFWTHQERLQGVLATDPALVDRPERLEALLMEAIALTRSDAR